MAIHDTAIVLPDAQIGVDVEIGPYCVIAGGTQIGDRCALGPHVVIETGVSLGEGCQVSSGAVLGGPPQDLKYKGEPSYVRIGKNNIIRECVTIHRASGEGSATLVGDDNMIMAYAHIAHNCQIGNGVMIASYVGLSGYVVIEDRVVLGGMVGMHQFVRVGKLTMIGGFSRVVQDVPPFMLAQGEPLRPRGLNVVGLRRAGVGPEVREHLKQAHRLLYRSGLNREQAIERIVAELPSSPELTYLVEFLEKIDEGRKGRQLDAP